MSVESTSGVPVVEATGLSRTYDDRGHAVHAVRNVTVEVDAGEVLGITGSSGCGKSTTLRLLAGLERPDRGTIRIAGVDIWHGARREPSWPRPGFVMPIFQDPVASLDRRWPIWRSITEPLTVVQPRLSKPERRKLARTHLARVGLEHLDERSLPAQLSGGQAQRVAILRALVAEPALVVADEPTANLDVTTAAGVTRVLREAADLGIALVVVSHDQERLAVLCDRLVRMEYGRVAGEETLRGDPLMATRERPDDVRSSVTINWDTAP